MEPEGSLPQSQVPATCPYPEADPDKTYAHKIIFGKLLRDLRMKCFLVSNNFSETGFELEIWIQLASLFVIYLHGDEYSSTK